MNNELVEKLKWIRSEVLALKQAHEYGLNSPKFYYKIVRVDFPPTISEVDLRVIIKYDTDKNNMPMQIWNSSYYNIYGQTWNQNTKEFRMSYSTLGVFGDNIFSITTTKPIKSMELIVV